MLFPLPPLASAKEGSPEEQFSVLGIQFAAVYGLGFGAGSYISESTSLDTEIIESLKSIMMEHSQCETDAGINHL